MDLNNFSFTFQQLLGASYVELSYIAILLLASVIGFVVTFRMAKKKRMKSDAKEAKVMAWAFGLLSVFSLFISVFTFPNMLNGSKYRLVDEEVVSSVEETYNLELSGDAKFFVRQSVKSSLAELYGSYDLPDTVSLKDLGLNWQSAKFTVAGDDGLSTVYLANDTDGKTYLWVDKPASKEKFMK